MKCKQCGSDNIIMYARESKFRNYVITDFAGKKYLSNPKEKMKWDSIYDYYCFDCHDHSHFDSLENSKIYSARLDQKKIMLDLDHTLLVCYNVETDPDPKRFELQFECVSDYWGQEHKTEYKVVFRPHIKKFIKFIENHFDEVIVCTASIKNYATPIVNFLNIKNLTKLITREDLESSRPLTHFDREYIKKVNDCIVLEDKPHVVMGSGNTIFEMPTYWGSEDDNVLLKVMEEIKGGKKPRKYRFKPRRTDTEVAIDKLKDTLDFYKQTGARNVLDQAKEGLNKVFELHYRDYSKEIFSKAEKLDAKVKGGDACLKDYQNICLSFMNNQELFFYCLNKEPSKTLEIVARSLLPKMNENKNHWSNQVVLYLFQFFVQNFSEYSDSISKIASLLSLRIDDIKFLDEETKIKLNVIKNNTKQANTPIVQFLRKIK